MEFSDEDEDKESERIVLAAIKLAPPPETRKQSRKAVGIYVNLREMQGAHTGAIPAPSLALSLICTQANWMTERACGNGNDPARINEE